MIINIKPTVDCVFKALLGSEENKCLLINFINGVLDLSKGDLIVDMGKKYVCT